MKHAMFKISKSNHERLQKLASDSLSDNIKVGMAVVGNLAMSRGLDRIADIRREHAKLPIYLAATMRDSDKDIEI